MPEKTYSLFKDLVKELAFPLIGITCLFSFEAGILLAAKANTNRNGSYTHKKDVLAFPLREIITTEKIIQNGDTIVSKNKFFVRLVPDSVLQNVQP